MIAFIAGVAVGAIVTGLIAELTLGRRLHRLGDEKLASILDYRRERWCAKRGHRPVRERAGRY